MMLKIELQVKLQSL